ncbi:MAG TPA: polyphosphate kinase 1 [Candidatus Binatia bacterium]|nr:polyphosphate kinase 1 [Candidatus Binatia bacterium]
MSTQVATATPESASEASPAASASPFLNRELSLLQFNLRVLDQARDPSTPLLERLRFLTISSSNLDEFFEIRVAGLKQQIAAGVTTAGPDGLRPNEVLPRISEFAQQLVVQQYRILNELLLPALDREAIRILKRSTWNAAQRRWIQRYFEREVLPVLTPIGLDPAHPFPKIVNKSLNFVVSLQGTDAFGRQSERAVVQAPRVLPRLIQLPPEVAQAPFDFVMLSSIIHAHVGVLFPGMAVKGCNQFRVTRNSDLWVDEEEVEDLLHALQGELFRRNYGSAVRLEVTTNSSGPVTEFLLEQFELTRGDLFVVDGPVNLNRLSRLYDLVDRPDLKYPPFTPGLVTAPSASEDIFETIRARDVVLHHPYQSFAPVVDLVARASDDPNVLAIKQTLYRTGKDSPMAEALLRAARAGKEVTAVVELRARFDEQANIELATRLQELGAKVVYGIVGYKTHAKMLLVVRREGTTLRRYVHVGTGNYHTANTRHYTDISLLTCNEEIGDDVHNLFQQLTGLGRVSELKKLLQSPFSLHKALVDAIEAEAENARQGKPARVAAKMNALIEPTIIEALYRASQAGVPIDLIVRGMCCLKPGVAGLSENIRVRSVVGRFLEHCRIFYFLAGGQHRTYCGSADWMQRNFFGRVEACFPIEDPELRDRIVLEGITTYLEDDSQAWELQADGTYRRAEPRGGEPKRAQEILLARLATRVG